MGGEARKHEQQVTCHISAKWGNIYTDHVFSSFLLIVGILRKRQNFGYKEVNAFHFTCSK